MKKNYIDGQYIEGAAARENINPSDISEIVGIYSQADTAQTRAAIDVAHSAAEGWAKSTPQQRFDVLDAIGNELLARKAELGELLSREEGKTLPEGIGETARAGQIFKFFAGEALRLKGDKLASVRPGVDVEVVRESLGVIGIITPWNFPIAIPAWKIAPALCYGNAVVFKPADLVPGCGWALADIIARSGLPKGVFNLVMGRGSVVGEEILTNRKVKGVTFTGSVATGQHVAATCAGRMAKFQLEMGGKNPLVVLDDADLDSAVETAVQGAFFSTGQRCTASSRLIITEGIHDRFVAGVIKRLEGLKVDNALSDGVHIGPVVDDSQLAQDLEYIRVGQAEGAKLAFGGQLLERATKGFYLSPALFTETSNNMRINREEIFGPVASVIRVKNYEEALAVANDTEFGLSSGICTTSLKYATDFKRNAKAGMAMVNLPTAGVDYHVPFGGTKGSSFGSREQGSYAAEFFTTVKTSYTLA
ncbi:aldehyde dehydrogenase family protein [Kiloniella laminariae]|uniref:aldehyde dehydrogenase (NAD(+)) n=1 Tax=Kiloniella laminariae TaxID=454162 RepID=A0ABT4LI30_9PROT|nr:aldehyde dehydrogenase family protein [Kiloniella laminariae]MCZ4280764.1 aldehyde dehydrogenase family protein [Kiloniella laminariae]